MLPGMLNILIPAIKNSNAPAVYGKVFNLKQSTQKRRPVWVEPFNVRRLSKRNIISQPGVIIRREAWDSVGGLDESLYMSMDYDLWWRLYMKYGEFIFVDEFVAVNRDHDETKTNTKRALHYKESMMVVKKYFGSIPIKWWIYQPYSVWFKTLVNWI
jgi:GT2 family glycosyltransferase